MRSGSSDELIAMAYEVLKLVRHDEQLVKQCAEDALRKLQNGPDILLSA